MDIDERLIRAPVVPMVQADDPETAVHIAEALAAGGLELIEVVLRTAEALACLEAVAAALPRALVGAGTVLSAEQAGAALDAGAQFIVSPGLDDGVVGAAQELGVPALPGVATATELQRAWNLGLRTVKFFPAGNAGGPAMIKALSAAFRDMKFMPTGGVSAANLAEYLALPSVIACGGSWLTPARAAAAGDYSEITRLASEALEIAKAKRSN
jgi:2-dehydro-3-deoxyphosphogluconate aldolase / (4S)-4-hydroxy-2-oxoglutarate aldolase